MNKISKANRQSHGKLGNPKPDSMPGKSEKPLRSKTPPKNGFEKMAEIRASMTPFAERIVGLPFAADLGDDTIDFMNRAEISLRVEKQYAEQILQMLADFARENPAAKLRAGTFNA